MKSVNTPPAAARLIESLRHMGYDPATAIADLIDNSVAAGASEVRVQIMAQDGARPPFISIADNGRGMSTEELVNAMRFGAHQTYNAEDLGKFGLGLKTASLSQCDTLTVSTKPRAKEGTKPRAHFARWSMATIEKTDEWDLLLPTKDELEDWERAEFENALPSEGGTVVLWSELDEAMPLLAGHDVKQRERFLVQLIDDVSRHLRMVFHRFMDGTLYGRKKLHIHVCDEELEPWDPFCKNEKTKELDILKLRLAATVEGNEVEGDVILSPFVLPPESDFSSEKAHKDAAGPKGWNAQQGLYFYRNHRLLQSGGWSYLRTPDEHLKLLRIAVQFPNTLDRAFDLNITKMRAKIPSELREQIKSFVSKWGKDAQDRYRKAAHDNAAGDAGGPPSSATVENTPGKGAGNGARKASEQKTQARTSVSVPGVTLTLSNATTSSVTVAPTSNGALKLIVPQKHPGALIFDDETPDAARMSTILLLVLEAVFEKRLKHSLIPIEALRKAVRKST